MKRETAYQRWLNILPMLTAVIILLFLAGCATGGPYATFKRSRELDNRFLNYEVLPEHQYYTSGGYDKPDAILALHNDYELDNSAGLWVHVPKVDYYQMRKWIDTIAPDQDHRYSNSYFATYILSPDGEKIGAWYAIEVFTTVKFLEDNRVLVYTPDINMNHGFRGILFRPRSESP